jgi:hypothetical protein
MFDAIKSLRYAGLIGGRNMPKDDMSMWNFNPGMAGVVIDVHVIDRPAGNRQIVESLLSLEIGDWNHVDGRDHLAVMVISQERASGKRSWIDIEIAQTGQEIWQLD